MENYKIDIPFKSAFIVGALPSGLYAALYLHSKGIKVFVSEYKQQKDDENFSKAVALLNEQNIPFEFGKNTEVLLEEYEAIIVSPGVPLEAPIVQAALYLKKPVIGETEIAAYAGIESLAVTGSNGKSTTTALLGEIIKQKYPEAAIGGNLGTPVSQLLVEKPGTKLAVLEVSCFQLETIHAFHPRIAIFSNLVPNHLNRYGTMEKYYSTKKRLFKNMTEKDYILLNSEDPKLLELGGTLKQKIYYFGLKNKLDGAQIKYGAVIFKDKEKEVELFKISDLLIPGKHNIINAMSAALAGYLYGVSPASIKNAIRNFRGLAHRLEFVGNNGKINFINDSKATTPESTVVGCQAMKEPYVVILGGSSKDVSFTKMARFLAKDKNLNAAVIMGETGEEIGKALKQEGVKKIIPAKSLEDSAAKGIQALNKGGTLLLSPACASFDMYKNFEERGDKFKKIIEENYLSRKN